MGLRWRQNDSTDSFTNASYEVCLLVFFDDLFFDVFFENLILPAYVRSLTVQDHDHYLNKLTLMDEIRLADPAFKGWTHYRET